VGGWTDRQAGRINNESGPQDSLPRWEEPQPDHWLLVRLLIESPFFSDLKYRAEVSEKLHRGQIAPGMTGILKLFGTRNIE